MLKDFSMKIYFPVLIIAISLFGSCTKNGNLDPRIPTLDTLIVIRTSPPGVAYANKVILESAILDDGGEDITETGVCYALHNNPTVKDSVSLYPFGAGTGIFIIGVKNLQSDQRYYAKAYAKNKFGTAYGNRISFIVKSSPPQVMLRELILSTSTSLELKLYIYSNGGWPVS